MKLLKLVRFGGDAEARRRKLAVKKRRRRIENIDDSARRAEDGDMMKRNYSSYAELVAHRTAKLFKVAA